MSSIIAMEIRAAEGDDDAKLFVGELAKAYERLAETRNQIARSLAAIAVHGAVNAHSQH